MQEHLRDRGRKKWTALMLPEHLQLLREWQKEDTYTKRTELSEWDLETIHEELSRAKQRKCQTLIQIWRDGKVVSFRGTVEHLDPRLSLVLLEDPFGIERIPAGEIISVQHMD